MLRTFYDYQAEAFCCLRDGTVDWLLEFPTGGGKTTVGSAIMVDRVLGTGPTTHGIIAAPQLVIEDGFHLDGITALGFPAAEEPPILIQGGTIRRAGDDGSSVQAVRDYLDDPAPGYVLTCTHAALVPSLSNRIQADCSGMTLLVDEAHHVGACGLGAAVENWSRLGGRLIFATATPFRTDGRPVKREGMRVYRRTMPEQMKDGRYAPEHVAHGIVPVGAAGDIVTRDEFTGRKASGERRIQEDIADKMVRQWAAMGYPKSIFRVPVLAGGSSPLVQLLKAKLSAARRPGNLPVRTLDATGTSGRDQRRVQVTLLSERSRPFAKSEIDVIIGVQRVREGFDWPHCSTVQCVGLPGSMVDVVQFLGRAMRPKGLDHNPMHRDRGAILFYVPGAGRLGEYDQAFSRHALAVCVTLVNYEAAEGTILDRIVRESIAGHDAERATPPVSARPEISPDQLAAIHGTMAIVAAQADREGRTVTLGCLVDAAAEDHPELSRRDLNRIAASILVGDDENAAESLRRSLVGYPPADLDEALEAVVDEFRGQTLRDSGFLGDIAANFHAVAGFDLALWANKVAIQSLWDFDVVASSAKAIYDRDGAWPKTNSTELADGSRTFANFASYLGSVKNTSLHAFLSSRFPGIYQSNRKYKNDKIDLNEVGKSANEYLRSNHKLPPASSKCQATSAGLNWNQIYQYIYRSGISKSPADYLRELALASEGHNVSSRS